MNRELIVFKEAFFARLLPVFKEVELEAIRNFHLDIYPNFALIAAMGALLASALLYCFGIWLRRMPERVSTGVQRARIERMQKPARYWLPWLLILSPTPIGCALIMAAGFFRVRVRVAGLVMIAAEMAWRVSPILHQ